MKSTIDNLETTVASWYKNVPHLPENVRKWISLNAWWLTLIGVILSVLGVLAVILATFFAGAVLGTVGAPTGVALIGGALVGVAVLSMFMGITTIVLGALAVSPLKTLQKKGWTLLFIMELVQIVGSVISYLFVYDLFGLLWSLLSSAVAAYFLFEIRGFYGTGHTAKKATVVSSAKKA